MRTRFTFAFVAAAVVSAFACGSSSVSNGGQADAGSEPDATSQLCMPGRSVACTGVGGCAGGQACNADGTAFGVCDCGGSNDAGTPADGAASHDGSDASDGSQPPDAGWSPKGLSDLILWVDGQHFGDAGASITTWPDQSGGGHDLVFTGNNSPPTVHAGAINGLPAASFAGGSTSELTSTSGAFGLGTSNFVFAIVAKASVACANSICGIATMGPITGVAYDSIVYFDNLAPPNVGAIWGSLLGQVPVQSTFATYAAGAAHVLVMHRSSATAGALRVDGVPTTQSLAPGANGNGVGDAGGLSIGFEEQSSTYFDGDIAEVVVALSPSDSDVASLEMFLRTKYAL
jgi:hypothetical protein